jgi:hypothetical protein
MKALTIRNLPKDLAWRIARDARAKKISLNRAAIDLLHAACGGPAAPRSPQEHHDLDALFGVWSPKDLAEFNRSLAAQRVVDSELWTR